MQNHEEDKVEKLIQIFTAYSVSYLEMALELHREGSLDKNKLADRLKRTADRKEEFGFTDITEEIIRQLASGLDSTEPTDEVKIEEV